MVAIIPSIIAATLTSFLIFTGRPRLPKFSLTVKNIYPTFLEDSTPALSVGTKIKMYNGNFITAAVHAFTFDLYYPEWDNELRYIGQVTDLRQQQTQLKPQQENNGNVTVTTKTDSNPIWVLSPRADFEVVDDVMLIPSNAGTKVFSSLTWDVIKKRGILHLPLSGVFHIKANGILKLSMSMICEDNLLDAWKMEFESISCEMDYVGLGWTDLTKESERLQLKVLTVADD